MTPIDKLWCQFVDEANYAKAAELEKDVRKLIRQARAEALEEAARLFDRDNWPADAGHLMASAIQPRLAAAAIRQLSTTKQGEQR